MRSIINENVLLESSSARNELFSTRTENHSKECLNKAKAVILATWKATDYGTTEYVAEYYEVSTDTIKSVIKNNREEFDKEVKFISGSELHDARSFIDLPSKTSQALIWSARAIHRVGFLLRDSEVAKEVRTVTLNVVESASRLIPTNPQPTQAEVDEYHLNLRKLSGVKRLIARLELKYNFNDMHSVVKNYKSEGEVNPFYSYSAIIVNQCYQRVFGGNKMYLCSQLGLPESKQINLRDHISLESLNALLTFENYLNQAITGLGYNPYDALNIAENLMNTDTKWKNIKLPVECKRAPSITCPSTFSEEDWLNHWKYELGELERLIQRHLLMFRENSNNALTES